MWIELVDGLRDQHVALTVFRAVDLLYESVCGVVQLCDVAHADLCPRELVAVPAVDLVGGIDIGEAEGFIESGQVRLVDATHGVAAGLHPVVVDEVGKHLVASLQQQLVGNHLRHQQLVMVGGIAELRHLTLQEVLLQEGGVVFGTYALEHRPEEVVISLQDALCHRVALYVADTLDALDFCHQTVVQTNGVRIGSAIGQHVVHLNMTAESHDLVADGVLEPQHDTHGDNHHSQADSHPDDGYTNSRATHIPFVALVAIKSPCYE